MPFKVIETVVYEGVPDDVSRFFVTLDNNQILTCHLAKHYGANTFAIRRTRWPDSVATAANVLAKKMAAAYWIMMSFEDALEGIEAIITSDTIVGLQDVEVCVQHRLRSAPVERVTIPGKIVGLETAWQPRTSR